MDCIELEESSGLAPTADLRPRMDEPPPVRLIAIDDVQLITPAGKTDDLHRFYVDLWQFTRETATDRIVFRAENFSLRFEIIAGQKPLEHISVRPTGIEVRSLRDAELKLVEAEIDYIRQRGLLPGQISLLTQDPAGNWIELFDAIPVG